MEKKYVSLVYDRKHKSENTGFGKVEILVLLSRTAKKYITVKECSCLEWKVYKNDKELLSKAKLYNDIVLHMRKNDEEMTIENFNRHLGLSQKTSVSAKAVELQKRLNYQKSNTGLIDFIEDCIKTETLAVGTLKRRQVVIESLKTYGLTSVSQLTPDNLKKYDYYLRKGEGVKREAPAVNNYHKTLKKYVRMLANLRYIESNPYDNPICKFERGRCKERKPLNEEELQLLINLELTSEKEIKARDLFIFSAYTGLAYADAQNFDFDTMTEEVDGTYYIDGERVKTGSNFFTPILPPAMDVLEKYDYHLPKLSNQKMNDYLHLIEAQAGINKPLTSHVARHSFATLLLSHDVPIENVMRMLGHQDIKTTQIYAKVLKSTIQRQTKSLIGKLASSNQTKPKTSKKTSESKHKEPKQEEPIKAKTIPSEHYEVNTYNPQFTETSGDYNITFFG